MNSTIINDPVHVITSVQRRRRWSPMEKEQIVKETFEPGNSVALVARKYNIARSPLFQWRRYMENGASQGIETEENLVPESEYKKLEQRVKNLERLLGRKTEENEILKEAVILARKKTDLAKAIGRNRRFSISRIASTLGVSRSIFYYKNRGCQKKHSIAEFKEHILQTTKDACHDRPTYGYPRITAIVNRINRSQDLPRVNHKRIYRIMKEQNLLLQRNAPRLKRTHEGKIITLKSNVRWCSGILGIRCWDGRLIWIAMIEKL
ncbi:transposase [Leptospira noguchii str. Cascata]|nr:transposase [Leptospira noguchii str. Cascata]